MAKVYSSSALAELLQNRGGVLNAIDDGIRSDYIEDPEIRAAWAEVEIHFAQVSQEANRVRYMVDRAANPEAYADD